MPFGGFGFGQGYFGQSYMFGTVPEQVPKGRGIDLQANVDEAIESLLANVDGEDTFLAGEGED